MYCSLGPRLTLAAVALFTLSTTVVHAQTAQISGTVTDPTKAVVPGATLTIVNAETNDTRGAVSNERGQYNVPFLPSGRYTVTCELQGFQKIRREGIVLETDQEIRVDFDLQAGEISESILVVGTPVLASDTSSVGQVVTGQTISDLPLNGRNFLQLARLATGVLESAAGDRAAEGGAFVANGARSVLNSFMLDGVDNNARIVDQQNSANVVSQPSVDALSEFSIQTNNFSAEYGQAAGAVINATIRSGTNSLRGVGFEFVRNDAFDARNLFPWVTDTTPVGFGFKGIPEVAGVTGLPRIAIGGFSNIGEAAFLPNFKISEVIQAGDTFSFLHGRHALKAGANYRFIRSFFDISGQARGFYNFTGGFTQNPQARTNSGSGLADFLLGIPSTTQLSRTLLGAIRYHYVAGYLQDDWRMSPASR
jgi:hypothetical protein